MDYLFITGYYRSGGTLLEKLLNLQDNFRIFSQPFPILYYNIKNEFLQTNYQKQFYPFDPLVNGNYDTSLFNDFLEKYFPSKNKLTEIKCRQLAYSGTHDQLNWGNNSVKSLSDFYKMVLKENTTNVELVGTRDAFCEELIPYYLKNNIKIILIIRDPRGLICSSNYGKSEQYTGAKKPLWYDLYMWRKSVAFALEFEFHKNFKVIKYEDLVLKPDFSILEIFESFNFTKKTSIISNKQLNWKGNSSFDDLVGVEKKPIYRYKDFLNEEITKQIEALCFSEMKYLNYEMNFVHSLPQKIDYSESFNAPNNSTKFYLFDSKFENERLELLRLGEKKVKEVSKFFIFKKAYTKLSKFAK